MLFAQDIRRVYFLPFPQAKFLQVAAGGEYQGYVTQVRDVQAGFYVHSGDDGAHP